MRLGALAGELEEAPDPGYQLHVPPRVLRAVLDGRATWETALLSMRCRLSRDPDRYDSTLMALLTWGDRPAQTRALAAQRGSGETIFRDGLVMQRWCPHAGEDLTYATVEGGVIDCPRHHWRWDAVTGECLAGGDVRLRVVAAPAMTGGPG